MGGQQPCHPTSTQWSDKLFSQEKLCTAKTQDEKLREVQTEFRDFGRKVESGLSTLSETVGRYGKQITELQTEIGFLKSVCTSMNIQIEEGKKGTWSVYVPASGPDMKDCSSPCLKIETESSNQEKIMENASDEPVYMTISELKNHIEGLRKLGKIHCDSPLSLGVLSKFAKALGIVDANENWSSSMRPTKFGIEYGYVSQRRKHRTSIKYNEN